MDTKISGSDYQVLSASQINNFYNCNRKWAYEYIKNIKPEINYPMKKGSFIHAVIEDFNNELKPRKFFNTKNLRVSVRDKIRSIAIRLLDDDKLTGQFKRKFKSNSNEIKEQLFNYVDCFLSRFRRLKNSHDFSEEKAWTLSRPTENELSVVIVDDNGNWLFRGDMDTVFEKHPLWFGKTCVIDYKTGSSPFNSNEPLKSDYNRQLNIYGWLFYQCFSVVPEQLGIHYLEENYDSSSAFYFKEFDKGELISTHLNIINVWEQTKSNDIGDYDRDPEYKFCEFKSGKCDHWDYCLGDKKMPGSKKRPYNGRETDPIEVKLKDPTSDDLSYAEKSDYVLKAP
jgi:hypothetical protein